MEFILLFEIFLQSTTNQTINMTEFFQSTHFKTTPPPIPPISPFSSKSSPFPQYNHFLESWRTSFMKSVGSSYGPDTLSLVIQSLCFSQKQCVFENIFCFTFNIKFQRYSVKGFLLLQKGYFENFQRKPKEIFPWVCRWKIEGKHLSILYRIYLKTFEKLYLNGSNFYFICFQNCL